jgi:hypothetical protein
MSTTMRKVVSLLKDDGLDAAEKISRLRQIEADLLARGRAATEGMTPAGGENDGEALKAVTLALARLGEEPAEPGAATL